MKQKIDKVNVFIRSQHAEAGPPLGTVLGNLGLNATKFAKEFNEFTKDLPTYFYLQVEIKITEDKGFELRVRLPTTGFLLGLLRREQTHLVRGKSIKESFVLARDVVELAQLKLPGVPLRAATSIICGSALAAQLSVIDEQ